MNRKEYEKAVRNTFAEIARLDPKVKEADKADYLTFMDKAGAAGFNTGNKLINKYLTFTFCVFTESMESSDLFTFKDVYREFDELKSQNKARSMKAIDSIAQQISVCKGSVSNETEAALEPISMFYLNDLIKYENEHNINETEIPADPFFDPEEEERKRKEEEARKKAEEEEKQRREKEEAERRKSEEKKKNTFSDETTYEDFLEKAVSNGWDKKRDGEFLKFTFDWFRSLKDPEKKKEYSFIPEKLYKNKVKNTYIKLSYVTTVSNLSNLSMETLWSYEERAAKESFADKEVFTKYASYAGWKDDEELIDFLYEMADMGHNKDPLGHFQHNYKQFNKDLLDELIKFVMNLYEKKVSDSKGKYEQLTRAKFFISHKALEKHRVKYNELLKKYGTAAGIKNIDEVEIDEAIKEKVVKKEADRKKAEEEEKKRKEEEARKKAEEEEKKRKEEEARKKAEEEERKRREKEEADRKKSEEDEKKRQEEERKQAEERKRLDEESKKKAEEERKQAEEENRNNIENKEIKEDNAEDDEEKEKARLISKRADQLNAVRLKMLEELQNAKNVLMQEGRKNTKLYRTAHGEELSAEKKEENFLKDGSVYYRRMARALNNCIELLSSPNMCDEEMIHTVFFELENKAIQYQNYNKPFLGGGSEQKTGSGAIRYQAAEKFEKFAGIYRMEYKYLNHELESLTGEQGGCISNYLEAAEEYKQQYGFEDYDPVEEQNMFKSYGEVSFYRSRIVNYMAGKDKAFRSFFRFYSPSMDLDRFLEDENGPKTMEEKAKWYIYKHELDRVFKDSLTPAETKRIYKKILDEDRMTLIKQKVSSLKRNPAFTHLMESGRQDAYSSFYAARMNDAQAGKGRKQNVGMKDMDNLTLMGKNNIINEEKTDSLSLNTKQRSNIFDLQD